MPNNVNIAMAVSKHNPDLMSLMNRAVASVDNAIIYNSLALNSNVNKKVTFIDYVAENPVMVVIVSCVIIFVLIMIIIRLRIANTKAKTDAMTGLLNKIAMREMVRDEIKRGGILFMIDIDNFKDINDKLGHEAGDIVISCMANILTDIFHDANLISRFGGDEFLVFLPKMDNSEIYVEDVVKRMQDGLSDCSVIKNNKNKVNLSVSVGVLFLKENNSFTYSDAFRKVDEALYEAKEKGKKTYVIAK